MTQQLEREMPTPLVRFGRRQSKGVLLGFSGLRLVVIGVGLVVLVMSTFFAGTTGLMVSAPLWALLIATAFLRWNGQPLADAAPIVTHWFARRVLRQTTFRARLFAPRPAGTMALPGDVAALRFYADPTGVAMIHDPHRQTLSAVVRVSHPAYVLLSPDDQARRVTAWSRVLASLSATGSCAGLQLLESTLPDPGHGVRDWYAAHGRHDSSWASNRVRVPGRGPGAGVHTHRTLIVLSLDLRKAAKAVREAGRGIVAAADVLRADITTCTTSLRSADLTCRGLARSRRTGACHSGCLRPDDRSGDAGVAGHRGPDRHRRALGLPAARFGLLRGALDQRVATHRRFPHFLHSLVFLQQVRKTISIVVKPLSTSEALRSIRKEKVEYLTEAQQAARIGKIADFADEQEYADVLARERALVSGHADLRFSGFISITAPTREELTAAVAAVDRAAAQSGCETRTMYGQQAQAFAIAALPLGRGVH